MLRVFAGLSLLSSAIAGAQTAPPVPPEQPVETPTVAPVAEPPAATPAPVVAEAPPVEEPKMKKVCFAEDVVGSAFPRMICKMKPIKPKDAK